MAKRIKIEETDEEIEAQADWKPEPGQTQTIQADEDTELDTIFSDLQQNESCIELFRIKPQGGHPLFLEQITPAIFSFAYVKELWGGGRYQAKAKYKDGKRKRLVFEVEGPPKAEVKPSSRVDMPLPSIPPFSYAPQAEPAPTGDGNQAILMLLQQLIKQTQSSEMQMLEKMKMYKDLFATPQGPAAPLDQALNMFQRGVELATLNSGEAGGANFWMTAIKELKEPLTQLMGVVQTAMTAKPPQQINPVKHTAAPPVVHPGTPAQAPTGQPAQGEDMNLGVIGLVKALMPNLVTAAAKNADPEFYAGYILDQVPESAYSGLKNWLGEEGCLDKLAFLEPAIRYQADWWSELRVELLKALNDSSIQSQPNQHAPAVDDSDGEGALA